MTPLAQNVGFSTDKTATSRYCPNWKSSCMESKRGNKVFPAAYSLAWPFGPGVKVGNLFGIRNCVLLLPSHQSGSILRGLIKGINAVIAPMTSTMLEVRCLAGLASFVGMCLQHKLSILLNINKRSRRRLESLREGRGRSLMPTLHNIGGWRRRQHRPGKTAAPLCNASNKNSSKWS